MATSAGPSSNAAANLTRRRDTPTLVAGRARARHLGARLGTALRDARSAAGLTQAQAAHRARLSQPRWSELERGEGSNAPLAVWTLAAGAIGEQLAAFLEHSPGSSLPRDIEHLRRQNAVIELARAGSWEARPEVPVEVGPRGRVVDVLLARPRRREAAVVEVWDLLLDVGDAFRTFDQKLAAVSRNLSGWRVTGCWVLRGTHRNRRLLRELGALMEARFPASGRSWIAALRDPEAPLPDSAGLLWTDAGGTRLRGWTPGRRAR